MISHGLGPVGLRFKGLYFEAARTWHVQHEFSDCSRDIFFIRYEDNFLTRGYNIIKCRQFSCRVRLSDY